MRKIRKPLKSFLVPLALFIVGGVLLATCILLINHFSEPGVPLAEAYPGLYLPVMLLALGGILPLTYGLFGLTISAITVRGMRVYIDGAILDGIKVHNSRYQSDTVEGLRREMESKLAEQGFSPFADEGVYYRGAKKAMAGNVFYFAALNEFYDSGETLLARTNAIWEKVSQIHSSTMQKEMNIMVFLPLAEVTDEQLVKILEFKAKLVQEAKGLCDICLYSLSEKRSYMTFTATRVPGHPLTLENGRLVFVNICNGIKKIDFARLYAKKTPPAAVASTDVKNEEGAEVNTSAENAPSENVPAENAEAVKKLRLKQEEVICPKIRNGVFICLTVFASILVGVFLLMLLLWLTVMKMPALQFCCIFMSLFLFPGLALGYFAVASYKRLEISSDGARLIRPFGNVKIFDGELQFAEKFLATASPSTVNKCVFVIYPADASIESPIVFPVNNYKSYIILQYSDFNKELLTAH